MFLGHTEAELFADVGSTQDSWSILVYIIEQVFPVPGAKYTCQLNPALLYI